MAKITDTTAIPPAPKPPRTFTMELDEAELALLTLVVARVSGDQAKQWAADTLAREDAWSETVPSDRDRSKAGPVRTVA